ncbi:tigger transposable element-derived protein 4-like isoform [Elysia marginata]|uniref:Tigger transposable element-derived protein 4-like isoform n=1 Tax=Elysia marginata TaxID=1093978 RepID=A0AAV4JK44_9GAST|nr:tigger transposable element-derived protein 4-like isoform [Elysia marginata]
MSKRKHSAYTIDFKLQILSEAEEKKLTKTEICKKLSIPNSTLSTILKDTEKLQKARDDSKLRRLQMKQNFAVTKDYRMQCLLGFAKRWR